MSKFVVVVFPDETRAAEGVQLLDDLDEEGSLTLYATATVSKDSEGKVSQEETKGRGPRGMVLGALVGGLVGLIGGPAVAAVGAAGGALMGGWRDTLDLGVDFDFLDDVGRELKAGHSAVVAALDEEWVTPLDTRMEAIGGIVLRSWREDADDQRLRTEIEIARVELAHYKAEFAQAREETKARLTARVDEARAKLKRAADRTQSRIDRLQQETEAKVEALQQQMTHAAQDAKAGLNKRMAEIRADHEKRIAKLRQVLEDYGKDSV